MSVATTVDQNVDQASTYCWVRNGVYYFSRRIPTDLLHHYTVKRIVMTLRTRLRTVALKRARKIAEQLERFWDKLRWGTEDIPGKRFLKDYEDGSLHTRHRQAASSSPSARPPAHNSVENAGQNASTTLGERSRNASLNASQNDLITIHKQSQNDQAGGSVDQTVNHPTLLDAKDTYARLKGAGKNKQFHQTTDRAVGYAVEILGNKKLSAYKKADATKLRDTLFKRDMAPGTVRRMIAVVRSVFNFAVSELGLDLINPFMHLYLGENKIVKKRKPIPEKSRLHIQRRCVEMDDEARWLVAIISDTGMRLSEAAGLHVNDIVLNDDAPHVIVQPHKWRRLKNAGSERKIPLVGAALWAACQIKSMHKTYAFPRYCDGKTTKSNSASAALNKWINSIDKGHHVIHGFRHAIRDRLRAIECPSDVIDQIGGWTTAGVGQSYGHGYPLNVLGKWMTKL